MIETGAACNRRCRFCPQSVHPRADEWMSDEVFYKIIDDFDRAEYKQRITLNSYNEPTRDKRLVEFIRHIRTQLPQTWILFNTNGDYIKKAADIERYFFAGLNGMQINIYSAQDGCGDREKIEAGNKKAEKRYEQMQALVDSISWLDQGSGIYLKGSPEDARCQVMRKWDLQPEDVADHANTAPAVKHGETVRNHISNRCGSIPGFVGAMTEPLKKACVRPFRAFMIDWEGNSYLCCNDYYGDAVVGNVMERSVVEMFNDPRYHAYRIKLQEKDRNIFLCDVCDYTGGFYQHNVPHVTLGAERDAKIIAADMRSQEAAGFVPLTKLRRR